MKTRHYRPLLLAIIVSSLLACGVDRDDAKYDERRYKEIQKADCAELATILSKPFFTKNPEDETAVLQRCHRLKQLSFAEYKQIAERARVTGKWEFE